VRREPPRPGEILRNYSLIDKARARLGYSPQVKLENGLQQTYEWFSSLNVAASS
jgi:nucleoside-diphosphate-sugar epimerase